MCTVALVVVRVVAQSPAITRVSVDSAGGQADSGSTSGSLGADGRFVAFASAASNLVEGDTNVVRDVFVHDRQTGITERVSVGSLREEANGSSNRISGGGVEGRQFALD